MVQLGARNMGIGCVMLSQEMFYYGQKNFANRTKALFLVPKVPIGFVRPDVVLWILPT